MPPHCLLLIVMNVKVIDVTTLENRLNGFMVH